MTSDDALQATDEAILLKVLLKQRHIQGHRAFCREYDKVAGKVEPQLKGSWPSRAQFYRWLSGELVGLPYADHCRILEGMFPDWGAEQLFQPYNGGISFVPQPAVSDNQPSVIQAATTAQVPADDSGVTVYAHRNSVPSELWDTVISDATERIDLLMHAALFLVERPRFIKALAAKAAAGATIRLLFGDPDSAEVATRGEEEQLGDGTLAARIRNALAFYRPLREIDGVQMRFHRTTLYNSIFRFDDQIVVNTHVYGIQGAHAPSLHVRRPTAPDLFETYAESFETVWTQSEPATF